jgi:hypothetical protein
LHALLPVLAAMLPLLAASLITLWLFERLALSHQPRVARWLGFRQAKSLHEGKDHQT